MNHKDKLEWLRKVGFFTKGAVYCILGGLAAVAAFGAGGKVAGKDGVMTFLWSMPMGKVLVGLSALGLAAYAFWRFYSAYEDPRSDDDERRWGSKLRYVYSGVFYAALAYSFSKPLFSNSSSGGDKKKMMLGKLLETDWGIGLIIAIAALIAAQAFFQAYIAYQGKFMKKIDEHPSAYRWVKVIGRIGYYSRFVVFAILSYLLIQVIVDNNADAYDGTKGVFHHLLTYDYGNVLMAAVAIGLLGYGLFSILIARYSNLTRLA
jgi:hypothetical protein